MKIFLFLLGLILTVRCDVLKEIEEQKARKEKIKEEIMIEVENLGFPLSSEALLDFSIRYFIEKDKTDVMSAVNKVENLEPTTDIEHEDFTSYLMMKHYIEKNEQNLKNLESLNEFFNVEKLMNHSKENSKYLMKIIIEKELDRQGITDEKTRRQMLGQTGEENEDL